MLGAEGLLPNRQGTLERRQRFADFPARGAGIAKVLERAGSGKMIGRERALTDVEHSTPELFRRFVHAERLPDVGEAREDRGNFGVVLSFASFELEQTE